MINLDPVGDRERRQVRVADAQQMVAARARVSGAYHPIAAQRLLNTQVELERVGVLQIVVGGL